MAFLFTIFSFSQVSVGSEDSTNQSQPVEPYYEYSYSQTIYNANLINASGQITGLKYFATATTDLENTGTWDIYMAHTDLNEHPQNENGEFSFVDASELTLVFSGPVEVVDQTVTITLDTPFDYNGTQNLIVAGHDTMDTGTYDGSGDDFYASLYDGNSRIALVYYNDVTPPDPLAPPLPSDALLRYANIVFEGITQQCPNPTDISVSNILGTSADFTWSSGENVVGYEYAILPAGEEFESGTTITENSVSISGLDPLTNYVLHIRSMCDGEYSGVVSYAFTTGCADLFELPYSESFEQDSENEICWTIIDLSPEAAPNNSSWNTNVSNAFDGSQAAWMYTFGNAGKNDDYLISPRFNLSGNDRIKFVAKSYGNGQPNNSMAVLMSTTTSNPEDFTITLSETTEYSGDWTEFSVDLSPYSGPAFIAFYVPPTAEEGYGMYVDAIVVEEMPDCDIPINISVSNESLNGADVVWSAGASEETEWEYVVQLAELDPPTDSGTVVENSEVVLDNLESGSDYIFYVRAVCSEGVYSEYTSLGGDFSTVAVGDNCAAAIQIDALPYSVSDDTANYSNYYSGLPGDGCADTIYDYLGGNDVVYSYTATSDSSITVFMSPGNTYSGIFAYDSCENIGVQCYAAALNGSSTENLSFEMNVSAEMTYYIVISTWPSPYTTDYDLVITENTCSPPVMSTSTTSCTDDQFYIDVDVSDLGSSPQFVISDDQGNEQSVDGAGVLTFGPYSGANPVTINAIGDDVNCDQTFTVLSPCQACVPLGGNCGSGDGFVGLVIADIDNSDSGCSEDGYGIFPDLTTDLAQGATYPVTVTTGYSNQYVRAWVDFNDDYEYSLDELVIDNALIASVGTTDIDAIIPADANLGTHSMRFKSNWNSNVPDDACEVSTWSEVEDYFVTIVESLSTNDYLLEGLKIYPNPVNGDFITIKSPIAGDKFINLFDINGRKVLSTTLVGDILEISSFGAGFYMIEVTVGDSKKVSKLVIE